MPGEPLTLPFLLGLDQSGDRRAKSTGLERLENARIERDGAIVKRGGYAAVPNGTTNLAGGTVENFQRLIPHGAGVVGLKPDGVWVRARADSGGWIESGELPVMGAPRRNVVARDGRGHCVRGGVSVVNGVLLHCWELQLDDDFERFVHVRVEDVETGALLNASYTSNVSLTRGAYPKTLKSGNGLYLFYVKLGGTQPSPVWTLTGYRYDTTTLAWGSAVSMITGLSTDSGQHIYDVSVGPSGNFAVLRTHYVAGV
jgi:hypothetical protein